MPHLISSCLFLCPVLSCLVRELFCVVYCVVVLCCLVLWCLLLCCLVLSCLALYFVVLSDVVLFSLILVLSWSRRQGRDESYEQGRRRNRPFLLTMGTHFFSCICPFLWWLILSCFRLFYDLSFRDLSCLVFVFVATCLFMSCLASCLVSISSIFRCWDPWK